MNTYLGYWILRVNFIHAYGISKLVLNMHSVHGVR